MELNQQQQLIRRQPIQHKINKFPNEQRLIIVNSERSPLNRISDICSLRAAMCKSHKSKIHLDNPTPQIVFTLLRRFIHFSNVQTELRYRRWCCTAKALNSRMLKFRQRHFNSKIQKIQRTLAVERRNARSMNKKHIHSFSAEFSQPLHSLHNCQLTRQSLPFLYVYIWPGDSVFYECAVNTDWKAVNFQEWQENAIFVFLLRFTFVLFFKTWRSIIRTHEPLI